MSTAAVGGRLEWTDIAKGLAIVLVVVHHAVTFGDAAGWLPAPVVNLNLELAAFRMPLFFLASGLFAGSALAKPWGVVARRRLALWAYLYVLWVLLRLAFFAVVPDVRGAEQVDGVGDLLGQILVPQSGLWFLYALAGFTVSAKLTRSAPAALQVAAAAVLSAIVTSGMVTIESVGWRGMCAYYVFFLVGMHASGWVKAAASRATRLAAVALAGAAVVLTGAITSADLGGIPGVFLVQACVAVAAGVSVAVIIARTPLGQVLRSLGERTLPIYLVHVLWIGAGVAAIDALVHPDGLLGVVLMLALVATAVPVSLLVRTGAVRIRQGWLFDLPRRGSRDEQRAAKSALPARQH